MAKQKNATTTKSQTDSLHETSVGISQKLREQMIALCNQQLANTTDLYTQTKQAHWNVKGVYFEQFHGLFDKMAESIFDFSDVIAERAVALGGTAYGTTRMAANASELPEFPADLYEGIAVLRVVVERWAQYATSVRAAATLADEEGDLETSDIFVGISREADKMLWFAEAHLQA